MDTDDYALVSDKEVSELKQDVDYLKKNPLGGTAGRALHQSIEKLNEQITELISIFKEASETMKAEERESDVIARKIEPIYQRIDDLTQQNEKIARGILAVADMITQQGQQQRPQPMQQKPMLPPMPAPPRPAMPAPRPMPMQRSPIMSSPMGPPPMPPPAPKEKKGFLGGLLKK